MSWTLLRQTTLLWAAVYGVAAALDRLHWALSPPGLAEALCWWLVLSLLAALPVVGRFVTGLGRGHRRLLAGTVATLLFGQLMAGETPFPLVSWRMFSGQIHRLGPFEYFSYIAETDAGSRIPLSPSRLFPSLDAFRITNGLSDLVDRSLSPEATEARTRDRLLLDGVLAAAGGAHTAAHPDDRVRWVGVERCRIDPTNRAAGTAPRCNRVWTADVPPRTK